MLVQQQLGKLGHRPSKASSSERAALQSMQTAAADGSWRRQLDEVRSKDTTGIDRSALLMAPIGENSQAKRDAPRERHPVQIAEQWRDVIVYFRPEHTSRAAAFSTDWSLS